jgi:hypothetical protein
MKIAFICGSLEPGKDGVGDYTLRLAKELARHGHQTSIIAIHDVHASEIFESEELNTKDVNRILRLPSRLPGEQSLRRFQAWINRINPDWMSLQFVPFAFHRKGLPFLLANELAKLGKGRRWHIMFHELWVGMPTTASKKHIIWGWMQKKIVQSLVKRLKPAVTHTQCKLYYLQLLSIGVNASPLPLFSNIPIGNVKESNQAGGKDVLSPSEDLAIVMFGTIHPQALLDQFLSEVNIYRQKTGSSVSLTLVGHTGEHQKKWTTKFQDAGMRVQVLGVQGVALISELLTNATFGVSTSAMATIEKSGSVVAMLEHALPVICVGDCWEPREFYLPAPPPGIYTLKDGCIEDIVNSRVSRSHDYSVSAVAKTFIESLQKHS